MFHYHFFLSLFFVILFSCVKPEKNSVFYINNGTEPTTLHHFNSMTDGGASTVKNYLLESLLDQSVVDLSWKPRLATSYDISSDGMSATFYLRKNVQFHDGSPFSAEDVKYSYDQIMNPDYKSIAVKSYYEGIKEVRIDNPHQVTFIFNNKYYKNFEIASTMQIVSKKFYEQKQKKKSYFNKNLIGTGPYKISLYKRANRILLEKYSNWWGDKNSENQDDLPREHQFEKIVLRFVSDDNVALEMLKKGGLDFKGLRPEEYVRKTDDKSFKEKLEKYIVNNKTPKGYSFIGWNLKHPILRDKMVRKALYHLVNRDLMIEKFEYGYSVKAQGPIYPESDYASSDLKPLAFNPVLAEKILRQRGWKDTDGDKILDKVIDGKKMKLSITILEPWAGFLKYLTIFKEDARLKGVEIKIKQIEWNSFIKLIDERKFEAIRLAWSASLDWDPTQIWHSKSINGGSNFIGYSNKRVDEIADQARFIHDREQRIKLLQEAEKIIANDYPYVWFTYKNQTMYAHTKRIEKPVQTYPYSIGTTYWSFAQEMRIYE